MLDELQPGEDLMRGALAVAEEMASLPRRTFARIKLQMRAAVLARIEDALAGNEPVLESWLDEEVSSASTLILGTRKT
jgi:hypothetical protein